MSKSLKFDFFANSRNLPVLVYNPSLSAIAQAKVTKLKDYNSLYSIPTVELVTSINDIPFGITLTSIDSLKRNEVIKFGIIENIDTSTNSLLDPVYFDSTGSIVFTPGSRQIGYILEIGASGKIFIDLTVDESYQRSLTEKKITISTSGILDNLSTLEYALVKLSNATNLTGILKPSSSKNVIIITNDSSGELIIENDSASSDADNRIITGTGSNLTVPASASVFLFYDEKWHVLGGSGGGGGSITQGDTIIQTQNFTGDGTTTIFTLDAAPAGYSYCWVWIGPAYQIPNDSWTMLGANIIFSDPPANTAKITIQYAKSIALAELSAVNKMIIFEETVTGVPKNIFNLPTTPSSINSILLFIGGSVQDPSKYNISGSVLTTLIPVPVGNQVVAAILNSSGVSNSIDAYIRREPYSLANNSIVSISTIFGSQVSGVYRFQDSDDPRIKGEIGLKHNGVGNDPDVVLESSNLSVNSILGTPLSLNFHIAGNVLSIQNLLGRTCALKIFREI